MHNTTRTLPHDWHPGSIPNNVEIDPTAYVETSFSFERYRSAAPLGVRIGRGASVYQGTMFDLGPRAVVEVHDFALLNGARIICDRSIRIGSHALISWNVVLMDTYRASRELAVRRTMMQQLDPQRARDSFPDDDASPVVIEDNVWLGFDVCVLPGVRIGQGSIVGARSVVYESVPPYSIAAGNPARVLRAIDRTSTASQAEHQRRPH
jgi:acetyltransferase-like isoleucine patch superfamily enzyme